MPSSTANVRAPRVGEPGRWHPRRVPLVNLVDETFVVGEPSMLAARIGEPGRWRDWWPDLELTVTRNRGAKGLQWAVTGALVGTAEVWLEPFADGTIVHLYLRCDFSSPRAPRAPRAPSQRSDRERARRTLAWKRFVHTLKDSIESGRAPGRPRPDLQEPALPAD